MFCLSHVDFCASSTLVDFPASLSLFISISNYPQPSLADMESGFLFSRTARFQRSLDDGVWEELVKRLMKERSIVCLIQLSCRLCGKENINEQSRGLTENVFMLSAQIWRTISIERIKVWVEEFEFGRKKGSPWMRDAREDDRLINFKPNLHHRVRFSFAKIGEHNK